MSKYQVIEQGLKIKNVDGFMQIVVQFEEYDEPNKLLWLCFHISEIQRELDDENNEALFITMARYNENCQEVIYEVCQELVDNMEPAEFNERILKQ